MSDLDDIARKFLFRSCQAAAKLGDVIVIDPLGDATMVHRIPGHYDPLWQMFPLEFDCVVDFPFPLKRLGFPATVTRTYYRNEIPDPESKVGGVAVFYTEVKP